MTLLAAALRPVDWIVIGAAFLLMLALWGVIILIVHLRRSSEQRQVQERLGLSTPDRDANTRVLRLWQDGQSVITTVPGSERRSWMERFRTTVSDTGWRISAEMLVLLLASLLVALFVVPYMLTERMLVGVAGAVALVMVFSGLLKRAVTKRTAVFERQFADALDLAVRSLRAGHPLIGSFHLISEEVSSPVGPIFGDICQQQALGRTLEEALREAADKHQSSDLKLFATSVSIQLRSGGNLADMMERLTAIIRDRMRLSRRVRVLTAQTQFSKQVLASLPFILFVLLSVLNPRYMAPLYDTGTGRILLLLAAAGIMMGTYVMNRMAVLRY